MARSQRDMTTFQAAQLTFTSLKITNLVELPSRARAGEYNTIQACVLADVIGCPALKGA